MDEDVTTRSANWERLESLAKILAGFSAVISAVAIPLFLNSYTEKNRRSEMLMRTMTDREKSDTDIRQSMFQALVSGYLGSLKEDLAKTDEASFRRRMMFLELLTVNFQEYFNTKPLFEDVYRGLQQNVLASSGDDRKKWEDLQDLLIKSSKNLIARQVTMLNTFGISTNFNIGTGLDKSICVRLYDREDFDRVRKNDGKSRFEAYEFGPWREDQRPCIGLPSVGNSDIVFEPEGNSRRQSIAVTLVNVVKASALVTVSLYEDIFARNVYQGSRLMNTMQFEVSRFDLPYMDNTKMSNGYRFALVLRDVDVERDEAELSVIRFRSDFISLRDRPYFEEMLQKLQGPDPTVP
jgi:hypothetical protein